MLPRWRKLVQILKVGACLLHMMHIQHIHSSIMSKLSVQRVCQVPECRDCTSIGENLSLLAAALSPVDREQWREAGLLARAYTVLKVGSYSSYTYIQYLHLHTVSTYL